MFLEEDETLPMIISSKLAEEKEDALIAMLKKHKKASGWTLADLRGINSSYCMHKIILKEGISSSVEH